METRFWAQPWLRLCLVFCFSLSFSTVFAVDRKAYHVSVYGSDSFVGSARFPLRTISTAARLVLPGDCVIVHRGVYRELISPSLSGTLRKPIVFCAVKGEKVEVKGSEVIRDWKSVGGGVWTVEIADGFFGWYNPYKDLIGGDWFFRKSLALHTGQVYLNGLPFVESAVLDSVGKWNCSSASGSVVIMANFGSADPNRELVEINVRSSCFYPARTGVDYITVRGFVFSQAATQWAAPTAEQVGMIGTNWSKGWVIEDNVVSDSRCVGITLGKDRASGQNVWSANMALDGSVLYNSVVDKAIGLGWNKESVGSHVVRRNRVFRCGAAGIAGSLGAAYSVIADNVVSDVYTVRNFYGAEMAGIKLHGAVDAVVSGNTVRNCFIGIWLDWMSQGTVVSGNILYDNDYVDFFPEVNHGPYLVSNNVFMSDYSLRDWSESGMYVGNLFGGAVSRAPQDRSTPYFTAGATVIAGRARVLGGDNRFVGNLFFGKDLAVLPIRPKMHKWDSEDKLLGYGTAVYDGSHFKNLLGGNVYLGGASGLSTSLDVAYFDTGSAKLVPSADVVFLELDIPQMDLLEFGRPDFSDKFFEVSSVSTASFKPLWERDVKLGTNGILEGLKVGNNRIRLKK